MVEYLEKLVKDGEYHKALTYADRLLLSESNTASDLLMIQYSILQARLNTSELYGALVSGQLTVKLAQEQCNWEIYANACIYLGIAYGHTRQHDAALNTFYNCLSTVTAEHLNRELEASAWYNIGISYRFLGDPKESAKALTSGLAVAEQAGLTRMAHALRHALIDAYLQSEAFEVIPELLAKCLHYLRTNPGEQKIQDSRRWHVQLRAEFALRTRRFARAITVIEKSLRQSQDDAQHMFYFLTLRARAAYLMGDYEDALGYILAARAKAVECRRYDLESEAAEFMYYLAKDDPSSIERVDTGLMAGSMNSHPRQVDPFPN